MFRLLLGTILFIAFDSFSQIPKGSYGHTYQDNLFCSSTIFITSDSTLIYNTGCEHRQSIGFHNYKMEKAGNLTVKRIPQKEVDLVLKCYKKDGDTSNMDYFNRIQIQGMDSSFWGEFDIILYDSLNRVDTVKSNGYYDIDKKKGDDFSFSIPMIDELEGEIRYFRLSDFKGTGNQYIIQTNLPHLVLFYFMFDLNYSDSNPFLVGKTYYKNNQIVVNDKDFFTKSKH